jgi:hypothetical protein
MLRRVFSLLAATWLAIAIAEPAALHVCEMHSGGATHQAAEAGSEAGPVDNAHGGHHAAGHESSAPDTPDAPHACTCLGDCSAVTVVLVPAAGHASFAPASVRREVATPTVRVARAATAGLRLPFATAPPILPAVLSLS